MGSSCRALSPERPSGQRSSAHQRHRQGRERLPGRQDQHPARLRPSALAPGYDIAAANRKAIEQRLPIARLDRARWVDPRRTASHRVDERRGPRAAAPDADGVGALGSGPAHWFRGGTRVGVAASPVLLDNATGHGHRSACCSAETSMADSLVTPWPKAVSRLAGPQRDRVEWRYPRRRRLTGESRHALDDFVAIARTTPGSGRGHAPEAQRTMRLCDFLKRWGPWGACVHGHAEPPLSFEMEPATGRPAAPSGNCRSGGSCWTKAVRNAAWNWRQRCWSRKRGRASSVVRSARRVDALRRIAARLRDEEARDYEWDNSAEWTLVLEPQLTLPAKVEYPRVPQGHQDELEAVHDFGRRWLRAVHVLPAITPPTSSRSEGSPEPWLSPSGTSLGRTLRGLRSARTAAERGTCGVAGRERSALHVRRVNAARSAKRRGDP